MSDVYEVLEKRRAAKARYDRSEKGRAAKARAWQTRKGKLAEKRAEARGPARNKGGMEGVWYEDDPRAADERGGFRFNFLG